MDYRYLKETLAQKYLQLSIFNFKLIDEEPAIVHRESTKHCSYPVYIRHDFSTSTNKKIYYGSYGMKNYIIIIDVMNCNNDYDEYLWRTFNFYNIVVKNANKLVTLDEMNNFELSTDDKQINWVWFRNKDFYLPDKIMYRAKSWIILNPDFKVNLWTDLKNNVELDDFISKLNDENKKYFIDGTINVKYIDDIKVVISKFYENNSDRLDSRFNIVWDELLDKKFKVSCLFKTDGFRVMMLNVVGGIYCDFNDTMCYFPMKYLLSLYKGEFFFGTDVGIERPECRNNYFMFNTIGNPEYLDMSIDILNSAIGEYYRITSREYCMLYVNLCNDALGKLKKNESVLQVIVNSELLKPILEDKKKNINRVCMLISNVFDYYKIGISDVINTELKHINQHSLACNKLITFKRQYKVNNECDYSSLVSEIITDEFLDYFLMKYACIMINGDLLVYTNIAFIRDVKNLVPFSKYDKMSSVSMMGHIYDATSYGSTKGYHIVDEQDMRSKFL